MLFVKNSCSEFRSWKFSPCDGSRIVGLSPTRGSLAIVVDCQHLWRSLEKVGCLGVQLNSFGLCLGKTNQSCHAAFM